jgi:hypothetical protein
MVNETPFESYVGVPEAVKLSDGALVKSMLTAFPSAVSAGQPLAVRGLQLLYVCADDVEMSVAIVAVASHCIGFLIVRVRGLRNNTDD